MIDAFKSSGSALSTPDGDPHTLTVPYVQQHHSMHHIVPMLYYRLTYKISVCYKKD